MRKNPKLSSWHRLSGIRLKMHYCRTFFTQVDDNAFVSQSSDTDKRSMPVMKSPGTNGPKGTIVAVSRLPIFKPSHVCTPIL